MTVQELINELNKVENKELPVLFQTTDLTDYTYVFDVEEEHISSGEEVYSDDGVEFEDGLVIRIDF
jgi:hypothetical protein